MRFRIALPFLVLSIPALAQFPGPSQEPSSGSYNDISAIVGSQTNLVSHASRFNHLLVGEASTKNSSFGGSPMSWLDTLIPNATTGSQIGVTATIGGGAIGAGSRTSDTITSGLGTSGGSAGAYLFGVNDDTGGGGPIALGSNSVGIHRSGSTGVTLGAQQDINSVVSTCSPTPDATLCAGTGTTIASLLTSGAFSSLATQDATSALTIGTGFTGGPKFKSGIVIDTNALRTAQGPNILGSNSTPALSMTTANYIVWYNGASASSAVWGGSSGNLNFFGNNLVVNGTAAVSCGAGSVNTATMIVTNGLVTHC